MGGCMPLMGTPDEEEELGQEELNDNATVIAEEFQECIKCFNDMKAEKDIDALISLIEKLLQKKMSIEINNPANPSTTSQEEGSRTPFSDRGSKILNYMKGLVDEKSFHRGIKTSVEILEKVASMSSILGWLSVVSYLLSTIEKGIDNQTECLNLLKSMVNLAKHVRGLKDKIPEEKLHKAIELIVMGSITCYSQLNSQVALRNIMATVDCQDLSSIQRDMDFFIADLMLTVLINIDAHTPRYVPPKQPVYPHHAVGIEKTVKEVLDLLEGRKNLTLAVVIYGIGGVGKTTIAKAVVAKTNLDDYNYTCVYMVEEQKPDSYKDLQQQILRCCFPCHNSGLLNNLEEGKEELTSAFKCEKNKPIFLFIDNVSTSHDLKKLLPDSFEGLPEGSRILVTTRRLATTYMFREQPLVYIDYLLKPLDKTYAMEILFSNPNECGKIEKQYIDRILKICSGVPLALKMFRVQLQKTKHVDTRCDHLLNDLENGEEIKAEQLSHRLLNSVAHDLDQYIWEAFLDICCFFSSNWMLRDVMYIVGGEAVISLLETGLVTSTAQRDDFSTMCFKGEEELIVPDIIAVMGQRLGKDSRITSVEAFSKAEDENRLAEIKGIWLSDDFHKRFFLSDEGTNILRKSLRILGLGDQIIMSRALCEKFEKLSFLHIGSCITQLPVELNLLDKLVVFHGPVSVKGEAILCKLPSSLLALKVMKQSSDVESEYSGMERSRCPKLVKIHFSGLSKLPKLPEGSDRLHPLNTFILDEFTSMEELHHQICGLPALSILSISKSTCLNHLPESFGNLTALQQLRLSDLWALEALPFSFSQLTALTHLDLKGCSNLKALPSSLQQLMALTDLSLSGCKSLESLPANFGHLTSLQYLNLSSCEKLQVLPVSFGDLAALKHLCLRDCSMLKSLHSNFVQLEALEYLDLCKCVQLETFPFVLADFRALNCCICSIELKEKLANQLGEVELMVV